MDAEDGPMDPLLTPSPIRHRRRKPLAFVCVCSFQVSGGWAPASLSVGGLSAVPSAVTIQGAELGLLG